MTSECFDDLKASDNNFTKVSFLSGYLGSQDLGAEDDRAG